MAWFDRLDAQAAAKVVTAKLRMELGHTLSIKWFADFGEFTDWAKGLHAEYKARKRAQLAANKAGKRKR